MQIQCPSCNALIDSGGSFCTACGAKLKVKKGVNRALIIVPIIAIILILASFVRFTQFNDSETDQQGIEIDGDFSDWSDVISVSDNVEPSPFNPNVDIVDYRVDSSRSQLSFYLQVRGDMLAGEPSGDNYVDTIYVFIDTDKNPDTGYYINGIGADYMLMVYGWSGDVLSSTLYSFTSTIQDWNYWEEERSAPAAINGPRIETQVRYYDLSLSENDVVDVLFYMQSYYVFEDFSDTIISNEPGALVVEQQGIGAESITGSGNRLLKLNIKAEGMDLIVRSIRFTRIGNGNDGDVSVVRLTDGNIAVDSGTLSNGAVNFQTNLVVSAGATLTLFGEVDLSSTSQTENTLGLRIMQPHDVVPNTGTTTLKNAFPQDGQYDLSYIDIIPEDVRIDGAFADWVGKHIRNDSNDNVRPNLDISKYGVSNTDYGPAFYLRVDGVIAGGVKVPYWNRVVKSDPGNDGGDVPPLPQPPKTGEDIVYIFIDTIPDIGYNDSIPIGADYMIEVRGRYNNVLSQSYYEWAGTISMEWKWTELGPVDVGLSTVEMEVGIDWADINVDPLNDHFYGYFLVTDWEKRHTDYSDTEGPIEGPTR